MFKRTEKDALADYTLFRADELPEAVGDFLKENKIIFPNEKILFCMCSSNYKDLIILSTNERVIHYFKINEDKKIDFVYWKDIKSINFDFFIAKIIITVYGADAINMEFGGSPLRDFFDELIWEWTMKPHYFRVGFRFYNYPYVYAQLFVYALYNVYKTEGKDFVPKFKKLLASGGSVSAEELAKIVGLDITKPEFWKLGIKQYEDFVNQLESLMK